MNLKKKKLVYIIPNLGTGGAEKLVLELSNHIDKTLFEVCIVVFYNQKEDTHNYDYLISKNIKIYFLNKKPGFDFSMFFKLTKLLKTLKPDIIHSHLDTLLYLIPSLTKKRKVFFTIHNTPSDEATGLQKFIRLYCFKCRNVVPIAISKTLALKTQKYYNLHRNVPTIDNGISLSNEVKQVSKKENENFIFINVSSFKPAKDHITLLKAYKEFHKMHKNSELWLLGDGDLRTNIMEYIKNNSIEGVTLYGNVSNVYDYLLKADVFLLTSLYEGLPLCLLEALSVGLPIVSTNVGGICDIIENNYNGFLVNERDVKNIVHNCDMLFNDVNLQKYISINALKSSKKYDIELCAKKHEKLYLNEGDVSIL